MTKAFSNGSEWDAWAPGWCHRCRSEESCPILDELFCGDGGVPAQWTPGPLALSPERYSCSEFVDAEQDARRAQWAAEAQPGFEADRATIIAEMPSAMRSEALKDPQLRHLKTEVRDILRKRD